MFTTVCRPANFYIFFQTISTLYFFQTCLIVYVSNNSVTSLSIWKKPAERCLYTVVYVDFSLTVCLHFALQNVSQSKFNCCVTS